MSTEETIGILMVMAGLAAVLIGCVAMFDEETWR
jgi:hypothetical protein